MDNVLAYANGDLHFLIEALAEVFLSEEQQEQIKTVLDHHSDCVYTVQARIKSHLPFSEWAFLERPLA